MLIYVLQWWPSWISDRHKKHKFVEDLPMIIPGNFGFNCPSGFREEVGHRLTLDPMGKYSNALFSETTNQTESKLDRIVHWMVVYRV
jgi:hypothetical protein